MYIGQSHMVGLGSESSMSEFKTFLVHSKAPSPHIEEVQKKARIEMPLWRSGAPLLCPLLP